VERGCGGVVTNSAPTEFVKMTKDTGLMLLEHLHVLSQEALDHADLTVLTGWFHLILHNTYSSCRC